MRKLIRNMLRIMLAIILAGLIYIIGILLINTVNDYQPEGGNYEVGAFQKYPPIEKGRTYSAISWNIGYAGLGKESDFFYDGGSMSRPDKNMFDQYFRGIDKRLLSYDTVDLIMLQEVDISSRRSYNVDQQGIIRLLLPEHESLFAINYNVHFVPMPWLNPMGGVVSGLQLLGKLRALSASWRPYKKDSSWPLGLFKPDRCYQMVEFDTDTSTRLYIINTHNSAFDDGRQRQGQIEMLYSIMRRAYDLGHYVIASGDWNLNPAGWKEKQYMSGDIPFLLSQPALKGPGDDWQVVYDPQYPTNRDVSAPYEQGITPCTTLDFFICSPNVLVKDMKVLYNAFEFSDHQPVYLRFELKP